MVSMRARLLTEFVGTFVFLSVIALSGAAGSLAPLVIGLALAAMVYMGGHVSGAHYNPAVTFGLFLRGVVTPPTMGLYWLTQLAAGLLAFWFAFLLTGHSGGVHPGPGVYWYSAVAAELVFTAALVLVVLNVAATKETAGNSYYGLAIGFTVVFAAFAGGSVSGGAFNPAVGTGPTLVHALIGHGSLAHWWIYLVGPFLGGAAAASVFEMQESVE